MFYKCTLTNVKTITIPNPAYESYLNHNRKYENDPILWGSIKEYAQENIPETIEITTEDDMILEVEEPKKYELFY